MKRGRGTAGNRRSNYDSRDRTETASDDIRANGPCDNGGNEGTVGERARKTGLDYKVATRGGRWMGNKVAVTPPSDGQADGDQDHVAKERDTGDESATTQPAGSLSECGRQTDSAAGMELTTDIDGSRDPNRRGDGTDDVEKTDHSNSDYKRTTS